MPDLVINHYVKIKLKCGLYHPCSHPGSFCCDLDMLIKSYKYAVDLHVKGVLSTFLKEIGSCFQSFFIVINFWGFIATYCFWWQWKTYQIFAIWMNVDYWRKIYFSLNRVLKKYITVRFINWYFIHHILAGVMHDRICIN